MATHEILSTVSRTGRVESVHRGSVVVVRDGAVLLAVGDPDQSIYARSAVKPFQALALIERGIAERLQITPEELALTSASHNGTPHHTGVAARLLARGGCGPDDLLCGPHAPFDGPASRAIAAAGGKPEKIHNNCSGKHAGFLLLAQDMGVPKHAYLDTECDSQVLVRQTVAAMAELSADRIEVGLDGCGAPTLMLPLSNLARAFANLSNPAGLPPVRAAACSALLRAVTRHPVTLAGTGRICTDLIQSAPGRIYCKNGAEGVYAFGLPGRGIGVAIKIDDGAERGYLPVVVDLLRALAFWPDGVPATLHRFHPMPVRNTQKREVGEVACTVRWPSTLSA